MTEGSLEKQIVSWNGKDAKEILQYRLRVHLLKTNVYNLSIADVNNDQVLTTEAQIPGDATGEQSLTLEKQYERTGDSAPLFARFSIRMKCLLRAQSAQVSTIPPLTPGAPPAIN